MEEVQDKGLVKMLRREERRNRKKRREGMEEEEEDKGIKEMVGERKE